MWSDLRFASRAVWRRPATTLVAVLCLALGVGGNVALFSVINAMLFRPPIGVRDPAGLVRVQIGDASAVALSRGSGSATSYPQYQQVRDQQARILAGVAAYAPREGTLGDGTDAQPVPLLIATENYFAVLGTTPLVGRFFDPEVTAANQVAVLSHAFWQRLYAGDRSILGRTIRINGTPLTVIGVAPKGFVGVDLGSPDLWVPMSLAFTDAFGSARQRGSGTYWLQMTGRLREGIGREQAVAALAQDTAGNAFEAVSAIPISLTPLTTMFFGDQRGRNPVPAWILGITAAVLLLACATVANLLLAQATRRGREISVRLALGASRGRIVRQLLLESVLVALLAGVAAVLLAVWSVSLIHLLPIPRISRLIDARSVWFAMGLALGTTLLFGLAPALWSARSDVAQLLKEGGARATRSGAWLQQSLMAVQIAISFVLLVSAGLFLTSLRNVKAIDSGLDVEKVLTVSVNLRSHGITGADAAAFYDRALDRVRALPGVEAAALGSNMPFYSSTHYGVKVLDGRADESQPSRVLTNVVDPDFFQTLGIGLVEGRLFSGQDRAGPMRVAAVSQRLVREEWRGPSPIGTCIIVVQLGNDCVRVVGIVADAHFGNPQGEPSAILYVSNLQQTAAGILFVRTRGEPEQLAAAVRSEIQSLDQNLPFVRVERLDARLRPIQIPWEVAASMFTVFGALAAVLATVGLYTVVSFLMSQRTRELGIRSALGATRGAIIGLVLRQGLRLTAAGIVAGAVASLWITRLFAGRMVGVRPGDPTSYITVVALLVGTAMLASCIPGIRAARVNPMTALRHD